MQFISSIDLMHVGPYQKIDREATRFSQDISLHALLYVPCTPPHAADRIKGKRNQIGTEVTTVLSQ